MLNVLRDLFYKLQEADDDMTAADKNYLDNMRKADELERKLTVSFDAQQERLFDDYLTYRLSACTEQTSHAFAKGFRLGALVFSEVFDEDC